MRIWRRILSLAGMAVLATVAFPQSGMPAGVVYTTSRRADLLDINTATAEQLKALPGMGEAYARRVIAGRPYTAKNQLVTRGVLPQAAYDKIAASVIARHPR